MYFSPEQFTEYASLVQQCYGALDPNSKHAERVFNRLADYEQLIHNTHRALHDDIIRELAR
jgi:hypothetical protein